MTEQDILQAGEQLRAIDNELRSLADPDSPEWQRALSLAEEQARLFARLLHHYNEIAARAIGQTDRAHEQTRQALDAVQQAIRQAGSIAVPSNAEPANERSL